MITVLFHVSHSLGLSHTPLNMNHYANKKSALESMLDMALLMANVSQLKAVLEQGPKFTLYSSLITLCHWYIFIYKAILGVLPSYLCSLLMKKSAGHYSLRSQANIMTACIFITVVSNVFITAFGVQPNAGV
uniref:Uncharacterized protein n=1 Tax=Cyprinus carpio TaxID=7962 RepID=A0A8C2L7U1_CYPCA